MSWRDIALVLAAEAESAEPLERVEARLRKRFQLVKAEVRKRARQAGLLPSPEP
jgi:hypothetical protein